MSESVNDIIPQRNIWMRGLLMLLMGICHQLAGTLMFFVALIQFLLTLLSDASNPRLRSFGRTLGLYQAQIACFESFATDEPPFPFADWPSAG
jgi:hypothetical protein